MVKQIVAALRDINRTLAEQNRLSSNGNDLIRLLNDSVNQVRRDLDVRLRTLEYHAHHHRLPEQPVDPAEQPVDPVGGESND